jgi:hypothetical protein
MNHMVSTHLYFYKHVLSEMGIHVSKERKKLKHLKSTQLSNYLNKMKQMIIFFEDVI